MQIELIDYVIMIVTAMCERSFLYSYYRLDSNMKKKKKIMIENIFHAAVQSSICQVHLTRFLVRFLPSHRVLRAIDRKKEMHLENEYRYCRCRHCIHYMNFNV